MFEYHPEKQPPYDVLLSQLGKFQLTERYPNNSNPATKPAMGALDPPGKVLLSIVIISQQEATKLGGFTPSKGKYVMVFVEATNYASISTKLDNDCCRLRDSKGNTYPLALDNIKGHDPDGIQRAAAGGPTSSQIYSDNVDGPIALNEVYVFDVPKDATGYSLYLP